MSPRSVYPAFYRRTFMIAAAVILGYALVRILNPFWGALGWAAVLAFLLHPLHLRLTRRLGGRAGVSAGILTACTPFVIIAPLTTLGFVFARQVASLINFMRGRSLLPLPALLGRIEGWPVIGGLIRWIRDHAAFSADQLRGWLAQGTQSVLGSAASISGSFVLGFVGTVVGFAMMLFLLFFLIRDGRKLTGHIVRLIPLEAERRDQLETHLGAVLRAVVYGTIITALIQGALVGVGFALVSLPSPVVFGVLAAIAAFIPSAGTGIVLVPAVLYLAFTHHWGAAVFLALWGGVVGLSDNVLRPMLAAQYAPVSTVAVFVGAIGGVGAFGLIGFLIGPVVLSLIAAVVRLSEESFQQGR